MKWAADWWGIEIMAESEMEACDLNAFANTIDKTAVKCYGDYDKVDYEIDDYSQILSEPAELVLRFVRD